MSTGNDGGAGSSRQLTKEGLLQMDYYQIYGLPTLSSTGIDKEHIRRQYRRLSLRFHPDKDPSAEARSVFERVKVACETLLDDELRASYDASFRASSGLSEGDRPGCRTTTGGVSDATRRAAEDARVAEEMLKSRDAQARAERAAQRRAAEEKEALAQRMAEELTQSTDAPFREMEASLVREWNIDEDLLAQKEAEGVRLLKQLREWYAPRREEKYEKGDGSPAQRRKVETQDSWKV